MADEAKTLGFLTDDDARALREWFTEGHLLVLALPDPVMEPPMPAAALSGLRKIVAELARREEIQL